MVAWLKLIKRHFIMITYTVCKVQQKHLYLCFFPLKHCWLQQRTPNYLHVVLQFEHVFDIIPIGIVTFAFTVVWDNLCRNSCMYLLYIMLSVVGVSIMTLVNLFLSPITSQTLLNLFACLKLVCFLFEFICSCILVTNSLTKPIKVQLWYRTDSPK